MNIAIKTAEFRSSHMPPEQILFQTVIQRAFLDATSQTTASNNSGSTMREKQEADAWFRDCRLGFRMVCDMAGMDADFLSEAYRRGKIDVNEFGKRTR